MIHPACPKDIGESINSAWSVRTTPLVIESPKAVTYNFFIFLVRLRSQNYRSITRQARNSRIWCANGENDNNRGEIACFQGRLTNNLYLCPWFKQPNKMNRTLAKIGLISSILPTSRSSIVMSPVFLLPSLNLTDSRASRYPVNIRTRSQSSCKTVCHESFQRLIYYSASPGHR